jgi:hypothetical protein
LVTDTRIVEAETRDEAIKNALELRNVINFESGDLEPTGKVKTELFNNGVK